MTPPDPHNTNASPPTFSELLARTTPHGPYGWTYDGSSDFTVGAKEDPQGSPICGVWQREGTERAEIITRLLNFAHAGGADLIVRLTECAEMLDSRIRCERETPGGQTTASPDIRRAKTLLAVLNGQTK